MLPFSATSFQRSSEPDPERSADQPLTHTRIGSSRAPASPSASRAILSLAAKRILAGVPVSRLLPGDASLANLLLVAATEINTDQDMDALAGALREDLR